MTDDGSGPADVLPDRDRRTLTRSPLGSAYRAQIDAARHGERWGFGDAVTGMFAAFLLSNVVGVVILGVAGWDSPSKIPMWGFGVLQIPLWAGYIGTTILAGRKGSGLRSSFGMSLRPYDPLVGLVVGITCQLVVLPLFYVPIFRLTGTDTKELSRPAKELASGAQSPWSWILFALLVSLVAPVVEELFFRGLLLRSLSKRGSAPVAAVLLSAAIFAGLHFQLLQLPGLFVFGVTLAGLAVATGRLGPAVFAHIGFNATTVVVLYLDYRSRLR